MMEHFSTTTKDDLLEKIDRVYEELSTLLKGETFKFLVAFSHESIDSTLDEEDLLSILAKIEKHVHYLRERPYIQA